MRAALYIPTLVAVRRNPALRESYERLLAAGKSQKAALTASIRKLLTVLKAMLKHGTKSETHHSSQA